MFDEEFRIICPDGIVKWIWSKTFPVKKNGEIIRTVGTAEDISLRKEYEEKIQIALNKERELNTLKSRFISTVSHEFRTPLGLILSSTELLQKYGFKWEEEKRIAQFERIKNAVDDLLGLMKDIIVISEEESDKIKILPVEIDIVNFLQELIEEVKAVSEKFTSIQFIHSNNPQKIFADKKLLRQIFLNLISNAVKFTPANKNILIKLTYAPEIVKIEIKDEGIGIPKTDLNNIFEPFIRANNVSEIKGSGLGLSIVKRALDLLNCNIKVSSKVNEGSVFTVTIPIKMNS